MISRVWQYVESSSSSSSALNDMDIATGVAGGPTLTPRREEEPSSRVLGLARNMRLPSYDTVGDDDVVLLVTDADEDEDDDAMVAAFLSSPFDDDDEEGTTAESSLPRV